MRTRTLSPALLLSLLALSACGGKKQDEQAGKNTSQDSSRTAAAPALVWPARDDTRPRVHAPEPLELTFEQLEAGGRVLIHNPIPRDTSVRILVEDSSATAPLTQLLKGEQKVTLYGGTARQPGGTTVSLVAGALVRPEADTVLGYLLVDDGKPDPYRHKVRIIVAEPRPAAATGDTGSWTAALYKLAPLPGVRSYLFDNAESRCSRDTKDRTGFAASDFAKQMNSLVGVCLRDNVIPLAGATSAAMAPAPDTATPHRLLGVLRAEGLPHGKTDEGLVWWTGRSVTGPSGPGGVELHFTGMDHPGTYRGKIDLAGAGGSGQVDLRVRVTHDWPLALLAIFVGVLLSTWLRDYVRTRRAVLDLQVTSTGLASRIARTDRVLQDLDSSHPGKHPYKVDPALRRDLQRMDRQVHQLQRDGAALEAGKPVHDTLRTALETCEQNVAAWEEFANVLWEMRENLSAARSRAGDLRPDADLPPLLEAAESHYAGETLSSDKLPAVRDAAALTGGAVAAWREVADAARRLRATLDADKDTAPDGKAAKARKALEAALDALWPATERAAVLEAGKAVQGAGVLFHGPRQGTKVLQMPVKIVGRLRGTGAERDPLVELLRGFDATPAGARTPVPARSPEAAASAAADARRVERERQRSDRWYFVITTLVAVGSGLSEVYLKDGSFGTMEHYLLALLWGFGTKMGIDTVRAAFEAGRLPWAARTGQTQVTPVQQVAPGTAGGGNAGAAAGGTPAKQAEAAAAAAGQAEGLGGSG